MDGRRQVAKSVHSVAVYLVDTLAVHLAVETVALKAALKEISMERMMDYLKDKLKDLLLVSPKVSWTVGKFFGLMDL